jgi:hypothetical protein
MEVNWSFKEPVYFDIIHNLQAVGGSHELDAEVKLCKTSKHYCSTHNEQNDNHDTHISVK